MASQTDSTRSWLHRPLFAILHMGHGLTPPLRVECQNTEEPVCVSISSQNPIKIIGIWPRHPSLRQTVSARQWILPDHPHAHAHAATAHGQAKNIQSTLGIILTLLNFFFFPLSPPPALITSHLLLKIDSPRTIAPGGSAAHLGGFFFFLNVFIMRCDTSFRSRFKMWVLHGNAEAASVYPL